MSTGLEFDAAAARRLEKVYLTPDVVAQRGAVLEALALEAGERVLDIGSGPGLLARDMAEAVGAEGRVRGETGDYFFSLNRYLFLAEKPGTP